MAKVGVRPDLILFADTGDEHPETYAYLPVINAWLSAAAFPQVVVVRRRPTRSRKTGIVYRTLRENCVANRTLPSLAFGRKGCSLKWKREPQDRYCNAWEPAQRTWAAGRRVVKVIGYDAGPKDMRRSKIKDDVKYVYRYLLREWGWDRDRCAAEILAAGLPVPPKSACWYCPASKPHELEALVRSNPQHGWDIVEMEQLAKPDLKKIEGMWRKSTRTRPGSMTPFILGVFARMGAEKRGQIRRPAALRVIQEVSSCWT